MKDQTQERIDYEAILRNEIAEQAGENCSDKEWESLKKEYAVDTMVKIMKESARQCLKIVLPYIGDKVEDWYSGSDADKSSILNLETDQKLLNKFGL